jgi:cellulose synthase (UDP-forming)
MTPEDLIPLLLVGAVACLLPRRWLRWRQAQVALASAVGVLVVVYLHWRLTETVMPVEAASLTGVFVWTVFMIEVMAWSDALILFAFLVNRTDRSPEADGHEARLRATKIEDLPEVDVYIATYNEPIEVLEKTTSGALALDWPRDKLHVWMLDDGRRPWLERYARRRGAGYMTRSDNKCAKAGNINAAIRATSAPFFLVLDADFVPQRNFLYRAMGFFADPRIGIVQIPHNFFNPDPMQSSLAMSKVMPDDQRFFFDAIMPGRDGYDCAFCCGSNGIVRRSALEDIGGAMPTGSVTEDMLLSLALKREGYVTRYLNEKLAYGLAPESIHAFFIQRARWARGAIQILFLPDGPLRSPGLRWHERAFFLPLHWVSQTLAQSLSMVIPAVFLLTGVPPLVGATLGEILSIQAPAIIATVVAMRLLAPHEYHPIAATAHAVLQAFRLLPVVLHTLVRPYGHAFKVTPKGQDGLVLRDQATVVVCFGICLATITGLLLNAHYPTEIVAMRHMVPIVMAWALFNAFVLMIVAKVAVTPPSKRKEERFALEEPVRIHLGPGRVEFGMTVDLSLSGGLLRLEAPPEGLQRGDWVAMEMAEVGVVPARIRRLVSRGTSAELGVEFAMPRSDDEIDRLSRTRNAVRGEADTTAQLLLAAGISDVQVRNISLTGALVELDGEAAAPPAGQPAVLKLEGGGIAPVEIVWSERDQERRVLRLGLRFSMIDSNLRLRMIEKLFTALPPYGVTNIAGWKIMAHLLTGTFKRDGLKSQVLPMHPTNAAGMILPDWLFDLMILDGEEDDGPAGCWEVERTPSERHAGGACSQCRIEGLSLKAAKRPGWQAQGTVCVRAQ